MHSSNCRSKTTNFPAGCGLKQSLSNPHTQKQHESRKNRSIVKPPGNATRKLIATLRPSRNMPFRTIAQIHASIEWALFYTCYHHPFEYVITRLKLTAQAEHSVLLAKAAEKAGCAAEFWFQADSGGEVNWTSKTEKQSWRQFSPSQFFRVSSDESHPLRRIAAS